MSFLSNRFFVASLTGIFAITAAQAATHPQIDVSPKARIVSKVDNSKVIALQGSHSTRVNQYTDMGRVSSSTMFQHMFLTLSSSDEQEFALHTLMDAQQDKSSPNYHQWMTPETFGQSFGPAQSDIAQVTAWLQDSGFTVEKVMQSGRFIEFSGTSGAVEAAFHTEMHQYMANGELRISNSTDVSIPAALAPVVVGPFALNNFRPKPQHAQLTHMVRGLDGQFHPATSNDGGLTTDTTLSPDLTLSGNGEHIVGGADFPVIFDSKPLISAGINGTGIKIGILGQTDVLLSDISTYRSVFGLPPANPNIIVVGNDPGTAAAGDDVESDLDLEVSGANAPGATIDFYTSGSSYFGGGVAASGLQIIENNTDDIISISYGFGCESELGSAELDALNFMWEQASSQGISVFVSSGDSGPDDCAGNGARTGNVYSVDGLSSTPFDVAVGGTMFDEGTATGATQYWGAANTAPPYESALSYIPEIVWNEGTFDTYGGETGTGAGTSGISLYFGTPSWQAGPGVPATDPNPTTTIQVTGYLTAGPHRYLPDVAMPAADAHDPTAFCSEGNCILDSNGNLISFYAVGGTSVAAPSMAGVQAIIDQKNGGRQGLPTYYYYRLAALQSTTNCNAATLPSSAGATCAFHDVQTGNNFIPTKSGATLANGEYIGWTANPGYDLTVGLGSPDVNNVATQWSTVSFNATTTAFTLSPTTGPTGQTENFSVTVKPVSGSGTPTGDVSIIAQALFGSVGFVTLSGGTASGTLAGSGLAALPAGTYNVYAHYAGSTTYGGSNSAPISVTIGTSATSIQNTSYAITAAPSDTPATTFTYGENVYINSQVCNPAGIAAGGCNTGTPTGSITYTLVNQNNVTLPTLVAPLDPYDTAYLDAGLGLPTFDIKPNYPSVAAPQVLAPGTYTVKTSYNGDSTYNASTGTPFTIVVGPATEAITLSAGTPDITSGATVILNASMATLDAASGGVAPTGTVTFTDTTTSTVLGTGTLTNGAVVFSVAGKITTTGAHSITAAYSGDSNYTAATSTAATVTVTTGAATTTTLAATVGGVASTTSQVGQTVVLTATVPAAATSGTVYFYDGTTLLTTGTVSATTHTAAAGRGETGLTAGTHSFTATYGGNATEASSTSAAVPYIVTKNTPTLSLASQGSGATTVGVPMNVVLAPSPTNTSPQSPAPTGTVNFLDGTNVLGTGAITYLSGLVPTFEASFTTAALKPGTHVLGAQYLGDANYGTATSNTETINIGLTTIAISAPTTVGAGIPFTITGTITPLVANTIAIGGTVTFTDTTTNTVLGTATVTAGVAKLTTATVTALGSHTISAVYSGDSNYYTSSTTATLSLSAVTPGFSISVYPSSLTITRGQGGQLLLTANTYGGYQGTGLTTISGLPAGASYIITNSPYVFSAPTNGSSTTTQTWNIFVTTYAPHAQAKPASFLWLPALMLAGLLGLRRKKFSARGRQLVVFAILMFGMIAVSGCGSSGGFPGTSTGTTTATVTMVGTGSTAASPNMSATATFSVTVQ